MLSLDKKSIIFSLLNRKKSFSGALVITESFLFHMSTIFYGVIFFKRVQEVAHEVDKSMTFAVLDSTILLCS